MSDTSTHNRDFSGHTLPNGKPETVKQYEAHIRRVTATMRSPQQRIEALDARLGKGVGAREERARLQADIDNAPAE